MTRGRTVGAGSVYHLVDPRDNGVRYVGATKNALAARLKGHLAKPARRVGPWIAELGAVGLAPIIVPVREGIPAAELDGAEQAEITRIIGSGGKLLNEQSVSQGHDLYWHNRADAEAAAWALLAETSVSVLGGPIAPGDTPEMLFWPSVRDFIMQIAPWWRELERPTDREYGWFHNRQAEAEKSLIDDAGQAWGGLRSLGDRSVDWRLKNAARLTIKLPWDNTADASRFLCLSAWYLAAVHPWRRLAELGRLVTDDASFINWAGRDRGVREALEFLAARTALSELYEKETEQSGEGPGQTLGLTVAAHCEVDLPDVLSGDAATYLRVYAKDHALTQPMADLLMRVDRHVLDSAFGDDVGAEVDRELGLAPGTTGRVAAALASHVYDGNGLLGRISDRSAAKLKVTGLPDYGSWRGPGVPWKQTISASLVHAGILIPPDVTPVRYVADVRSLWTPDDASIARAQAEIDLLEKQMRAA